MKRYYTRLIDLQLKEYQYRNKIIRLRKRILTEIDKSMINVIENHIIPPLVDEANRVKELIATLNREGFYEGKYLAAPWADEIDSVYFKLFLKRETQKKLEPQFDFIIAEMDEAEETENHVYWKQLRYEYNSLVEQDCTTDIHNLEVRINQLIEYLKDAK